MQVQYHLDFDDIAAYSSHHTHNSKDVRRKLWMARSSGIVFIVLLVLVWPRRGLGFLTVALAGYAIFYLLCYPSYYHWAAKRKTLKLYSGGQNRGVLGNHILGIDAGGVTEISDVGELRTAWSGIEKVEENQDYVFLYSGSYQAHIIPKRAFLSEAEAIEFFKLAQAYHSDSLRLPSPSKGAIKMAKDEKDALPDDSQQNDAMSEDEIDNNLRGSFPASDPPSWTLGIKHHQKAESEKDDADDSNESK